jgi:uncharacterized protein
MYVKTHESEARIVVAICDEDLIGKNFSEDEKQLNISERFYKGEKKSESEVVEIMKEATNLNLVGKKTIDLAIKNDIIEKESIITIKNVPHAQIFAL